MHIIIKCLLIFIISAPAYAKESFEFELGGDFVYSRLQRSVTGGSGASFSLISESGYGGHLNSVFYFSKNWQLFLSGQYRTFIYAASASRTINEPESSLLGIEAGTYIWLGDIGFISEC